MSLRSTSTTYDVVVGQTGGLDIFLLADEQTPEGTLGGSVDLFMADIDGNQINFAGNVSIVDAARWKIRVSPDASDFAAPGNFRGRFRVTDGLGKIVFYPNGAWDIWHVRAVV